MELGLYGAGKLGRYIASLLDEPCVFVDDTPEKQGTQIDGIPVLSMAEFSRQCAPQARLVSCIFLDGYDYPAHREQIKRQYGKSLLYFAPLLLEHGGCFHFYEPRHQLRQKQARYDELEKNLSDELSIRTLRGHLALRRSGTLEELPVTPIVDSMASLARHLPENINYVDIGAYDGDTIDAFLKSCGGKFGRIWALEPDARSRARLQERWGRRLGERLTVLSHGVSAGGGRRRFLSMGKIGSVLARDDEGNVEIDTIKLDEIPAPSPALYDMDIEGEDVAVLRDSLGFIRDTLPFLRLSAYHECDDLLEMHDMINGLDVGYRFILRCEKVNGFDLMLTCLPAK